MLCSDRVFAKVQNNMENTLNIQTNCETQTGLIIRKQQQLKQGSIITMMDTDLKMTQTINDTLVSGKEDEHT
jgi:hypothetical protein